MKNIGVFLSENFHFLEIKFSIYLNRRVFVMHLQLTAICTMMYLIKDITSHLTAYCDSLYLKPILNYFLLSGQIQTVSN